MPRKALHGWSQARSHREAQLLAPHLFTGVNVNVANRWKGKENESKAGRPRLLQDGHMTVLSEMIKE
eukprot:2785503-Amphidinium_carterae.1